MNFNIYTVVRNKKFDWLLFEFRGHVLLGKSLKDNLSLDMESRSKISMRVAEKWNKIAKILLNLDKYESEDEVINKCFEILGKAYEEKPVGLMARMLKRKEKEVEAFYDEQVAYKSTSADANLAVCYLKKMYDYLEISAHPFIDFRLKNEMLERLKGLENI